MGKTFYTLDELRFCKGMEVEFEWEDTWPNRSVKKLVRGKLWNLADGLYPIHIGVECGTVIQWVQIIHVKRIPEFDGIRNKPLMKLVL